MEETFTKIYKENLWKNDESASGNGSTLEVTGMLRKLLPDVFSRYGVQSLLDIPCGDMNWMADVVLGDIKYIGADVVPDLIEANKKKFDLHDIDFVVMDITRDPLPAVDMILVRDLLGHFSDADLHKALVNIKSSKAKYLAATTFPAHGNMERIATGEWRPINLVEFLGEPLEYVDEKLNTEGLRDKSLGIWEIL